MYIPSPISYPLLHSLNNVVNKKTLFLKILRFMFTNFFPNAFSFINNCFQMINLRIASVSGVTYTYKICKYGLDD